MKKIIIFCLLSFCILSCSGLGVKHPKVLVEITNNLLTDITNVQVGTTRSPMLAVPVNIKAGETVKIIIDTSKRLLGEDTYRLTFTTDKTVIKEYGYVDTIYPDKLTITIDGTDPKKIKWTELNKSSY